MAPISVEPISVDLIPYLVQEGPREKEIEELLTKCAHGNVLDDTARGRAVQSWMTKYPTQPCVELRTIPNRIKADKERVTEILARLDAGPHPEDVNTITPSTLALMTNGQRRKVVSALLTYQGGDQAELRGKFLQTLACAIRIGFGANEKAGRASAIVQDLWECVFLFDPAEAYEALKKEAVSTNQYGVAGMRRLIEGAARKPSCPPDWVNAVRALRELESGAVNPAKLVSFPMFVADDVFDGVIVAGSLRTILAPHAQAALDRLKANECPDAAFFEEPGQAAEDAKEDGKILPATVTRVSIRATAEAGFDPAVVAKVIDEAAAPQGNRCQRRHDRYKSYAVAPMIKQSSGGWSTRRPFDARVLTSYYNGARHPDLAYEYSEACRDFLPPLLRRVWAAKDPAILRSLCADLTALSQAAAAQRDALAAFADAAETRHAQAETLIGVTGEQHQLSSEALRFRDYYTLAVYNSGLIDSQLEYCKTKLQKIQTSE